MVRTDEDEVAGEQPVDAWPLVAAEGREGQLEPLASASLGEAGPAVGGVRERHWPRQRSGLATAAVTRESAQQQRVRHPSHTTPTTLRSDAHTSSAEMQSAKAEHSAAALTVSVNITVLAAVGIDPLAPDGREEGGVPPDCPTMHVRPARP